MVGKGYRKLRQKPPQITTINNKQAQSRTIISAEKEQLVRNMADWE